MSVAPTNHVTPPLDAPLPDVKHRVLLPPGSATRDRRGHRGQIGTALLSAGIFQLMAVPVYSFFANRIDLRWLMMFGLACFGIGMWSFTPITHDWGWEQLLLPSANNSAWRRL
jgi:hypothetical protein